jgi:DNA polymerase III delta subunit
MERLEIIGVRQSRFNAMLYFIYGTDSKKTREKLHELTDILHKKKPEAEIFKIESDHWNDVRFEEFLNGQGLFENKYIVVLDKVFENADAKESVLGMLKEIAGSDNVFIFIEGYVDTSTLKKIEKHAQKTQSFEEKVRVTEKTFNVFSLTDAFGRRDKKQMWILYQQALASGSEPEEIHGILFWQLKSIITAVSSKSASESGLKPFVFQKAVGFARNYSIEELKKMSERFIDIYHNARRGIVDMEIGLEKFILKM